MPSWGEAWSTNSEVNVKRTDATAMVFIFPFIWFSQLNDLRRLFKPPALAAACGNRAGKSSPKLPVSHQNTSTGTVWWGEQPVPPCGDPREPSSPGFDAPRPAREDSRPTESCKPSHPPPKLLVRTAGWEY